MQMNSVKYVDMRCRPYTFSVQLVRIYLILVTLVFFTSCGEDRTYEYEEKTEQSHWIQELMTDKYLWADSVRDLEWKEYFASPTDFIKKVSKYSPVTDKWSYCSIDTLEQDYHERGMFSHVNSYGLDLTLMTDPTGETTKQFGRILTIYPGSPASETSLSRGDFIALIDGEKVTSKTLQNLKKGREHTLVVNHLDVNYDDNSLFWQSTDTVNLAASRQVNDQPVWCSQMIRRDIAYIMCSNMTGSLVTDAVSSLMANNPKVLVFDLRLCNQGTIETANDIASMISPETGVFAQTLFNSARSAENHTYNVTKGHDGLTLCFITGSYTQGAAEWLVHGLKKLNAGDKIKVYGTKSMGQNIWLEECPSPYPFTVHLASAYVADCDGDYDYASGIIPDEVIDEFSFVQLYDYGDTDEVVLNHILSNYY